MDKNFNMITYEQILEQEAIAKGLQEDLLKIIEAEGDPALLPFGPTMVDFGISSWTMDITQEDLDNPKKLDGGLNIVSYTPTSQNLDDVFEEWYVPIIIILSAVITLIIAWLL